MPALPLDEAGKYVAAAYLVFLALVLIYIAIMASKLSRIETARTGISEADLERLLRLYACTQGERSRLHDLARRGRVRVWWAPYRSSVLIMSRESARRAGMSRSTSASETMAASSVGCNGGARTLGRGDVLTLRERY